MKDYNNIDDLYFDDNNLLNSSENNNNLDDIFNNLNKQYNEYIDLEEKENFKKIFYDPDKLENIILNKNQLDNTKNIIKINYKINNQTLNKKSNLFNNYNTKDERLIKLNKKYKEIHSKFSKSYLSGSDWYIGEDLFDNNYKIFKIINTIKFLEKHYKI